MKYNKIDIIELMNKNETCKKALQRLNESCKKHGISPTSEMYETLKNDIIMYLVASVPEIKEAFARNMYHELRGELA